MSFQQQARQTARRLRRAEQNSTFAFIDESLFGAPSGSQQRLTRGGSGPVGVVSQNSLARLTADPLANQKDSVVLSTGELRSIRGSASLSTVQQQRARQHEADEAKIALAEKSKERKEKMLRMEREHRQRQPDLTESQALQNDQDRVLLAHSNAALDEELDDVKHMNQMMLYAKCVTIRDAQIKEKAQLAAEALAEEKRLDMAMEAERIKTLRMYEERQRVRAAEQKVGKAVIVKQIQEREAERIRQQELREQEAQAMLQRIKELEEREEMERKGKIIAGRKLLEQVMEANNSQARAKLKKKQEEIEEDMRIAEYIRLREAREQEQEAEAQRIKAEKEAEISRLRALQERAQDRQSQIDELRAKRYQESKDRTWRREQLTEAQKRQSMRADIALAREEQRKEKGRRMAAQALQEREDYYRVLEWQRVQNEMDHKKAETEQNARIDHRNSLLAQIQVHEQEKATARQQFLSEGQGIAGQLEADKKKLLKLKAQKLSELERSGVPEKYRAELAKKKVMVASIH